MFSYTPKTSIEILVQDAILALIKYKTGITNIDQVKILDFAITFHKVESVIKISSILIKQRFSGEISRISSSEIKLCGSSSNEFVEFLRYRGARQLEDKQVFLEKI